MLFLQGWFDLASARHSMGTLRINSTLLDLKYHPASSTLQVTDQDGKFGLCFGRLIVQWFTFICYEFMFFLRGSNLYTVYVYGLL